MYYRNINNRTGNTKQEDVERKYEESSFYEFDNFDFVFSSEGLQS